MEWPDEEANSATGREEPSIKLQCDLNRERGNTTLVGKMMTGKKMNKNTVMAMIRRAWNLQEEVQILEIEINSFMFRFNDKEECDRIIRGRPWSIQGVLLNIKRWPELMVFQELQFDKCPIWVQFHNVPIEGMNLANAGRMGEEIGEVVMVENPIWKGRLLRSFMRVRVLININEPLTTGFWVPRPGRERIWVKVRYEKLQNYCFKCGVITHEPRECKREKKMAINCPENPMYGPELGTTPLKTWDEAVTFWK